MTRESFINDNPIANVLERHGIKLVGGGVERTAKCPFHEDNRASMTVNVSTGLWNCHAGCGGGSVIDLISKFEGISPTEVLKRNGVVKAHKPSAPVAHGPEPKFETVCDYDYHDASGKLVYQVVRQHAPCADKPCGYTKTFRQRRPDGKGGWVWNMEGVERILYRLPEIERDVKRGLPIFICEGEKDVLAMVERGFSATCNSGGAGKWTNAYSETLRGADCIIIADKDDPGRVHAKQVAESLQGIAKRVRTIELPDLNGRMVKDASDFFAAGGESWQIAEQADSIKTLAERIRARLFNVHVRPAPAMPRYFVLGTPICTPGNLTVLSGMAKGGKSAVADAAMAAVMALDQTRDCLGLTSNNLEGKAVLHIDTEQSISDHDTLIRRMLSRAGLSEPPPWFYSVCLTGFPTKDARAALPLMLAEMGRNHGGVHSAFVDGVADLAFDVNDPAEATELVCEWQGLAIKHDCPILGIIHFNPSAGDTRKTRGHLGSQLERKAETNLHLEKESATEIVTLWADKNRRAPISKDRGPRFKWSDAAGMHVTVESARSEKDREDLEKALNQAERVFAERPAMRRTDLELAVRNALTVSEKTAERKANEWIRLGVIRRAEAKQYVLCTPAE